jgi:hypothetical protein
MNRRACRVEIVTKSLGILSFTTTGLRTSIQAARVVITCGDESRSHVVVRSAEAPWTLPTDEEVGRLFPADLVSCVRAESDGATTLSCIASDRVLMFGAAAAAATLKRSWGWDESETILVRFSSTETTFKVDPRFEDGAWMVAEEMLEAEGA